MCVHGCRVHFFWRENIKNRQQRERDKFEAFFLMPINKVGSLIILITEGIRRCFDISKMMRKKPTAKLAPTPTCISDNAFRRGEQ
jgi:hypothetical protein